MLLNCAAAFTRWHNNIGPQNIFPATLRLYVAELEDHMPDAWHASFGPLFDAAPLGIVALDDTGHVIRANPALERMFGYDPGELVGQPLEVLVAEDAPELHAAYRASDADEPWMLPLGHGPEVRGCHKNGQIFPIQAGLSYLKLEQRVVPVVFVIDITARRRIEDENARLLRQSRAAQAIAEAARQRQAFLAEASRVLASSLDHQTTLDNLARIAVPFLGDGCTVDLLVDGHVQRVSAMHGVPEKDLLLHAMRPPLNDSQTLSSVLRTGQPVLTSEVNDTLLEHAAYNQAHVRVLRHLGVTSALMVPITARGQVIGALGMLITESERRYDDDDLALAQELALLAAQAIDHARLFDEAQAAMRSKDEALALLDTVMQSAPFGFAFVDREVRYRFINTQLADLNRLPPERHLGHTAAELFPHLVEYIEPLAMRVLETGMPLLNVAIAEAEPTNPAAPRHWLCSYYPVRTRDDSILGVGIMVLDVTEQKHAEAALRRSEEQFRLLAEHARDLVFRYRVTLPCGFDYVSPSAAALCGYTPEEHYADPDLLAKIVHPDDRPLLASLIKHPEDNVKPVEMRWLHKHGEIVWTEHQGVPIYDDAGRVIAIQGIARDITKRRHAEDAFRAAELRYRTLVEQIPAIIYTAAIDAHSSTMYVSPQIEPILGFSPEEWLADPELWLKLAHPDDRAQLLADVARMHKSNEPYSREYRSFTRAGRLVWLRDMARVVRDDDGTPLFMQGVVIDLTERKQAEEAVRRSEQLYRTLAHHFPNGVVMLFDHDLRYTIADGAGFELVSLSGDVLEGRTIWEAFPPDHVALIEPLYRAALAGQQSTVEMQYENRTALVHIVPVRDEQDNVIAGMVMTHDITERKHMERSLQEERAQLARRVEERTADLSAANAELARAARLKDEFLASMSHELRTPLNAVLGLSEALREQTYGSLNDQQDHALQTVEESGRHLLALINDILDLAKIDAGKMGVDIEDVLVEQMCQASMRMLRQAAQKKRIDMQLSLDPAATRVRADTRRLKQILVNLLSNAVKFTPDGGAVGLEVTADANEHVLRFTVWDTGIGIALDQLAHLFQPFVQLDRRLARRYEGTGLGLALVYRMTELHGGGVSVTSEEGVGSRFTVALPWSDAANGHGTAAGDCTACAPVGMQRVLIIEDSPTAAAQAERYFAECGMITQIHPRGSGVVESAISFQPNLIVLDLLLPDTTGWDVLTQLKADRRTRAIPVAIVSVVDGHAHPRAHEAVAHLIKPYTRADIQQLLHQLSHGFASTTDAERTSPSDSLPTILLAEDNEASSMIIADYLASVGYHVLVARNGTEAVAQARDARPALILMDVQMPGMDGLEATRRIRADSSIANVPILVLTALAMPGDRERCLQAGANEYLSKPISVRALATRIATYL
jgi:PAS domain S-box-containing protein